MEWILLVLFLVMYFIFGFEFTLIAVLSFGVISLWDKD